MPHRTGSADLPLHGGRVPPWLSSRMSALGRIIVEAIVYHYGRAEVLRRLSHPFWFQSFGAVMGMDWHSSGITTSVIGALKRGLAPVADELGIHVCGGKGMQSRRTPQELTTLGERTGLDAVQLVRTSKLVAKIDSAVVQDGFDLYLHSFIVASSGEWCVIQQGLNDARGEARRYHWLSEQLNGFLDSPHAAVEGRNQGLIVNLADVRAERNRNAGMALVHSGPDATIRTLRRYREDGNAALELFPDEDLPPSHASHLHLPAHHDVRASDVDLKRLHATLKAAAERGPKDFQELLLTPGVGARTVASLAFVGEVIHGAPSRFSDPARYSLAHGGKDGHPFPVPLHVYDQTIDVLKAAVSKARLGNDDRLAAIRNLDAQARRCEAWSRGPSLETFIAQERAASREYGGRTVFDRLDRRDGVRRADKN